MFGNTRNVRDVGGFDESFRIGNFEDIDLCLRLSEAQETLCVCYDYEVFHHGHKSFKDSEQSLDTCLEKNRQRFIEKWDCEGKELLRKYGL
jgi:GT2 family glycosyltransferase